MCVIQIRLGNGRIDFARVLLSRSQRALRKRAVHSPRRLNTSAPAPSGPPYNKGMRVLVRPGGVVVLLCMASTGGAQTLPEILSRVSEEAEVFRHVAPQVLAEETLTQRALKAPPRFHPRVGAAAAKPL